MTYGSWKRILEKYNGMCLCCKRKEPDVKITLDHIIPLSRGGKNTEENIQPLCTICNCKKFTKSIDYRSSENTSCIEYMYML